LGERPTRLNTVHIGATQLVPIRASADSRAIGGLSVGTVPVTALRDSGRFKGQSRSGDNP